MSQKYNRRDFLKTLGTGMAALALPSFLPDQRGLGALSQSTMQLGRVARDSISVYSEPSDKSQILFQRFFRTTSSISTTASNPKTARPTTRCGIACGAATCTAPSCRACATGSTRSKRPSPNQAN